MRGKNVALQQIAKTGTPWLCAVSKKGFKRMVTIGEFGVSGKDKKTLAKLIEGDYLFAYVLKPVRGILGVFEVTAPMYESSGVDDGYPYPYRVKLRKLSVVK